MQTGSLVNLICGFNAKGNPGLPKVGDGCTEYCWTDRHAYTVVEVRSPCRVVVQQDKATRIDKNGMSESQTYEFTPNPKAGKVLLSRRKDGRWRRVGSAKGNVFSFGSRDEYRDYSF